MADARLGPMVRLWGIEAAQLPPATASGDELVPLLFSIMQEALPFIDSAAPKHAGRQENRAVVTAKWKRKGSKSLAGSAAPVELMVRTIPFPDLQRVASGAEDSALGAEWAAASEAGEAWAGRRSVHADDAVPGSASWAEFRDCLKDRHAETEEAFTPSMVAHRTTTTWQCGAAELELEGGGGEGQERWGEFTLRLEEVRHRIGRPFLKDRVFSVLQLTCAAQPSNAKREFLIVNIPVTDLGSEGGDPPSPLSGDENVVVGAYASVERVRKMPGEEGSPIEWLMATASDARGALPMWMQSMAVPGKIAKDVPLFLSWLARQRQ